VSENSEQPIIKKIIKKGGDGHHGGAWKVAFADFMTAMMAFFLVMWLVGQKPDVREAVAGFFQDPGQFATKGKDGVLKGAASPIKKQNPVGSMVPKKDSGGSASSKEKKELEIAAKNIAEQVKKQSIFSKLKDNIKIEMTSEGLRIILNESEDSPAFFEPGSAKLLDKSAKILMIIAEELGNLENHIVIEGHTDASFGGRKKYSNWELSADRANAARQLMEVSGLYKRQVREVRGFADRFPMITDDANDDRNRRISLVVLFLSQESKQNQVEVGNDLMYDESQKPNNG